MDKIISEFSPKKRKKSSNLNQITNTAVAQPDLVFFFSEPLVEEVEIPGSSNKKLVSCENYQLSID
jgi:hypothetical protein